MVFGVDRFTSIPAAEVEFDRIKDPELKRSAGIGPLLAQTRAPDDPKLRQELLFGVLLEGQKDLEYRAELYEPYRPDLAHLRARSLDLAKIAALDATAKAAIDAFAEQHGGRLDDYFYLPPNSCKRWRRLCAMSQNALHSKKSAASPNSPAQNL